jgi:hypothetical protein
MVAYEDAGETEIAPPALRAPSPNTRERTQITIKISIVYLGRAGEGLFMLNSTHGNSFLLD